MVNRAPDWFAQAEKDLSTSMRCAAAGDHEWACFIAQQAAEKAVKALNLHHNQVVWGHSVAALLSQLPGEVSVPRELIERAGVLDTFYIAPRNLDSLPQGAPYQTFSRLQSDHAVEYAGAITEFVRNALAGPRPG